MNHKHQHFIIFFFLIHTSIFLQSQPAIITRIIQKDSSLIIFRHKEYPKLSVGVAIDKQTHAYYLVTCYGYVVDSVHMADGDYALVTQKKLDPFEYYNIVCQKIFDLIDIAQSQLRREGRINPAWEYAAFINSMVAEDSPDKIGKIIALDDLRKAYFDSYWQANTNNPRNFAEDTATIYKKYDRVKEGSMFITRDTTVYYNRDNTVKAYKAILVNKASKIIYYDRADAPIDSMLLNPAMVSVAIKEKKDVFQLYRGWLEMLRQSVEDNLQELEPMYKKYPYTFIRFANNKSGTVEQAFLKARHSLLRVNENIRIAAESDPKTYATFYHEKYKHREVNIEFVLALGLGYITGDMNGRRRYELTDHRGNVVAVISDKKIGHTSDGVTVDYYMAEVLSESDYSSFGAAQPGRVIEGEMYRYGFNGQEKGIEDDVDHYTALYWEYDSRLGRRWNVDPIPKSMVSGYSVLGNNPIMYVDPFGNDWYKNKSSGGYSWFDGSGKHKGYNHMATGTWSARNANNVSYYFGNSKDGLIMDSGNPLQEARVTAKGAKKPSIMDRSYYGKLYSYSKNDITDFNSNLYAYRNSRDNGGEANTSLSQMGVNFESFYQGDKQGRQLAFGFTGMVVLPFALMAAVETGAASFVYQGSSWIARKYGRAFAEEIAKAAIANRGNISKIDWSDVIVSTVMRRWKFAGARGVTELINSTNDFSIDGGGYKNSFLIGTNFEKSLDQTGSDLFFGALKVKYPGTFKEFTLDQIQSQFDVTFPKK